MGDQLDKLGEKRETIEMAREKARLDAISKYAEEKAMKKGMEMKEIEIAKKLIDMNMPLEQIIEATGLTEQQIEELQKKTN